MAEPLEAKVEPERRKVDGARHIRAGRGRSPRAALANVPLFHLS
jgi:hypothetical protein